MSLAGKPPTVVVDLSPKKKGKDGYLKSHDGFKDRACTETTSSNSLAVVPLVTKIGN